MTTKYEYDRIPYLLAFAEQSKFKDTYGGSADLVALESYWLKPKDKPSDTVILFMHPIGGGAYLPMVSALAKKGCHVIYCNSRYRGTDSALIMEKVVLDMAACVRDAKEKKGYKKGGMTKGYKKGGMTKGYKKGGMTKGYSKGGKVSK